MKTQQLWLFISVFLIWVNRYAVLNVALKLQFFKRRGCLLGNFELLSALLLEIGADLSSFGPEPF